MQRSVQIEPTSPPPKPDRGGAVKAHERPSRHTARATRLHRRPPRPRARAHRRRGDARHLRPAFFSLPPAPFSVLLRTSSFSKLLHSSLGSPPRSYQPAESQLISTPQCAAKGNSAAVAAGSFVLLPDLSTKAPNPHRQQGQNPRNPSCTRVLYLSSIDRFARMLVLPCSSLRGNTYVLASLTLRALSLFNKVRLVGAVVQHFPACIDYRANSLDICFVVPAPDCISLIQVCIYIKIAGKKTTKYELDYL